MTLLEICAWNTDLLDIISKKYCSKLRRRTNIVNRLKEFGRWSFVREIWISVGGVFKMRHNELLKIRCGPFQVSEQPQHSCIAALSYFVLPSMWPKNNIDRFRRAHLAESHPRSRKSFINHYWPTLHSLKRELWKVIKPELYVNTFLLKYLIRRK